MYSGVTATVETWILARQRYTPPYRHSLYHSKYSIENASVPSAPETGLGFTAWQESGGDVVDVGGVNLGKRREGTDQNEPPEPSRIGGSARRR